MSSGVNCTIELVSPVPPPGHGEQANVRGHSVLVMPTCMSLRGELPHDAKG